MQLHNRLLKLGRAIVAGALVAVVVAAACAPVQAEPVGPAGASDAVASVDLTDGNAVARKGKWIEVILSQQRLVAWQNGRAVMSSAISSGVRAHPTLRGTFKIYAKYRATRMRGPGYNLPGVPYTMYYSGGYAVHGAYWHHNFGHPMSHGCVNLPVAFAARLYAWAPIGTLVVVH
jgi:lipoprotein-anchoring transpeptidase ErfK/SrfK